MSPELGDHGIEGLAALLREHASASVDPVVDQAGRLALERQLREGAGDRRRPGRSLAFALAAATAVVALTFLGLRPRPLEYEVRGAHGDGSYVSAPEDAPVTVAFSDGSSLAADPGSRLRVDEVRSAGARVLVERGRTHVHVQHHATSAWNFVAGPFDVHVTGTRFDLAWDPQAESVDLLLFEGAVEVRGPYAETPIAVHAGQRFRADLASRSMTVMELSPAARGTPAKGPPAASAPAPPPAPTPEASLEAAPPAAEAPPEAAPLARPAPSSVPQESWTALVARGQFETVVAKAGERGASECVSSCSAADLKALADAARYTGRGSLAEDALLGLRRRFGGTRNGRSAAFLLGRLDEAHGRAAAAERWYDAYLSEAPAGELAAEALAGKMRVVMSSRGRLAAKPLAEDYLARYPNGVHAETAREILARVAH